MIGRKKNGKIKLCTQLVQQGYIFREKKEGKWEEESIKTSHDMLDLHSSSIIVVAWFGYSVDILQSVPSVFISEHPKGIDTILPVPSANHQQVVFHFPLLLFRSVILNEASHHDFIISVL